MKWSRQSCLGWHSRIHPFATSVCRSLCLWRRLTGLLFISRQSRSADFDCSSFPLWAPIVIFPRWFFSRSNSSCGCARDEWDIWLQSKCNGAFKSTCVCVREIISEKRSFPPSHWNNYSVASWTQIHNSIMSKFSLLIRFRWMGIATWGKKESQMKSKKNKRYFWIFESVLKW